MAKEKTVFAEQQALDGACGVNNIHHFFVSTKEKAKNKWSDWGELDLNTFDRSELDSGSPLIFTSFANTKDCKAAYDTLSKRFLKVFQSELTPNIFHSKNHRFFICVFDTSKKP